MSVLGTGRGGRVHAYEGGLSGKGRNMCVLRTGEGRGERGSGCVCGGGGVGLYVHLSAASAPSPQYLDASRRGHPCDCRYPPTMESPSEHLGETRGRGRWGRIS